MPTNNPYLFFQQLSHIVDAFFYTIICRLHTYNRSFTGAHWKAKQFSLCVFCRGKVKLADQLGWQTPFIKATLQCEHFTAAHCAVTDLVPVFLSSGGFITQKGKWRPTEFLKWDLNTVQRRPIAVSTGRNFNLHHWYHASHSLFPLMLPPDRFLTLHHRICL